MIYSSENSWLFVKTTKVGGASVELALSRIAGKASIITPLLPQEEKVRLSLDYPEPRGYELPLDEYTNFQRLVRRIKGRVPAAPYRNHSSAFEIQQRLGAKKFSSLFKFSIVRNPFDYIVSKYHWKLVKAKGLPMPNFRDWLTDNPEALLENRRITHISGKNAMDYMIKFENLVKDFRDIADKLRLDDKFFQDLSCIKLKGDSRSSFPKPSERFAEFPELLDLVFLLCKNECEIYGYTGPSR